jgi:aspartyl-tRNA synthetase
MRSLTSDAKSLIDQEIELAGWVDARRDHGKITFIDLRDRAGVVQLVFDKSLADPRPEDVISIKGKVRLRPQAMINEKIPTGKVEVALSDLVIISKARELPFPTGTDGYDIKEEIRLKYRYLDLRRARMAKNIRLRFQAMMFIRSYLAKQGFVEIETPILTKTTPEGARDFIVPSRLQPGKFYALPQSPQQYKQLLMVAGFERYFQFARCFRDEDPRRDRAYGEFTQLDLEMSFITQEDIMQLTEAMFSAMVTQLFPEKHIARSPWPRLSHREALKNYGSDKPDLREDKNDPDELAFSWTIDFPLFTEQSEADFFHGSGAAKFAPSHHMFTAPHPDDVKLLDSDPLKVRGLQHDLVLNGFEVGGGSVRIHDRAVQDKVFDLIGFTVGQKKQFEHMLTAFSFGVPPHGGIAPGIDRLLMAALGESSVREIIAFPTSASGQTSVMDAPSAASVGQLDELGIALIGSVRELFDRIIGELEQQKIAFRLYEHEPVSTSEEAAKVRKTSLAAGAKAILLYADGKPVMAALPGDRKIDTKKFKALVSAKDVRMATPEEVKEVTTVKIGAVPPFGHYFGITLYMDKSLRENSLVVFNAGRHERSLELKETDYEKIARPTVGDFTKDIEYAQEK